MRSKPWAIKAISITLLLVPLALLAMFYVSKSMGRITRISTSTVELVCLFGIASVVTAYSVWRVRIWGYALLFIFGLVVVIADTQQLIRDPKSLNPFYFVDLAMIACAFFLLTRKRVREVYFNPKVRWWERPKRHHVEFDGSFEIGSERITAPILDISIGGCFADMQAPSQIGESIKVKISHSNAELSCEGRIVRVSDNPRGAGIMFTNLSKSNRRQIKQIIKTLQA